jgi:hypothetical protein
MGIMARLTTDQQVHCIFQLVCILYNNLYSLSCLSAVAPPLPFRAFLKYMIRTPSENPRFIFATPQTRLLLTPGEHHLVYMYMY